MNYHKYLERKDSVAKKMKEAQAMARESESLGRR